MKLVVRLEMKVWFYRALVRFMKSPFFHLMGVAILAGCFAWVVSGC